eukprot:TRINITY_DN2681_c0_g1_i2.p1 TRINITY_DN2681_c0_g1~~TRINITY_DN2681_c0_g1_i2.p1  ORF type:complete len:198 (-),score=16.55 TRINITY_DN2681_c0_g1_i2:47-640(-)
MFGKTSFTSSFHKSVPQGTRHNRFVVSRQLQTQPIQRYKQCYNQENVNNNNEMESSFFVPTEFLKSALKKAVDNENYDLASQLNKEIGLREKDDPIVQLKAKLQQAIQDECFMDAVILRNQLNLRLSKDESSNEVRCSSNVTTNGIRVMVDSAYSSEFSKPKQNQHVFMYRLRIINQSDQTIQITKQNFGRYFVFKL